MRRGLCLGTPGREPVRDRVRDPPSAGAEHRGLRRRRRADAGVPAREHPARRPVAALPGGQRALGRPSDDARSARARRRVGHPGLADARVLRDCAVRDPAPGLRTARCRAQRGARRAALHRRAPRAPAERRRHQAAPDGGSGARRLAGAHARSDAVSARRLSAERAARCLPTGRGLHAHPQGCRARGVQHLLARARRQPACARCDPRAVRAHRLLRADLPAGIAEPFVAAHHDRCRSAGWADRLHGLALPFRCTTHSQKRNKAAASPRARSSPPAAGRDGDGACWPVSRSAI